MTPLHLAAGFGHSSVVEVLIRSHADVNAVDKVSKCIHTYNNIAYRQIAIGSSTYVTGFEKSHLPRTIINLYKYRF